MRHTVKKQILVVDDDQCILDALRRALHDCNDDWSLTFVRQPELAWERLLDSAYDAVVTDINMPGLNGMDLLERIRKNEKTKTVPVVLLTGLNERGLKEKALDLGAVDLMNKPIEAEQLIARLRNLLHQKSYEDNLRAHNLDLTEQLQQQTLDLAQSRMSVVCRLGMAAEYRDKDTGNHVARVGCYSRAVAAAMGMPESFLEMLLLSAPLHDIGKIGIPDSILLKPGPLDDEEWSIMKTHCRIGERILRNQSKSIVSLFDWYAFGTNTMREAIENNDPMLDMAATVALTHHEKWDGSGYPQQLAGEAIPLESRIVAIADVFDALTSNRHYRPARPEDEALSIIQATVGSHFEPGVYAAFLQALPDIRAIRARFNDNAAVFFEPEGVLV
jgi:putative two-component system response regulator